MDVRGEPVEQVEHARPKLSPHAEVTELPPPSSYGVVRSSRTGRYVRLGLPQFFFLRRLQGRQTLAELERMVQADGSLPTDMVRPLVDRFASLGLLEGCDEAPAERQRGRSRSLVAMQLDVADPSALLGRMAPLVAWLVRPLPLTVSLLLPVAGLGSLLARYQLALPSVVGASSLAVATVVALLVTTAVHELGHASVLFHFRGQVRRMGVMLFYLTPAAFCDVSDAWRLPPRQRAFVSLGGLWAQSILFGLAGLLLWLPLPPAVATAVSMYMAVSLLLMLANVDPFIKLDGYWVLCHLVDAPNLREHALARVGEVGAALLTWRRPPDRRHGGWLLLFGGACLAVTPVILIAALLSYQNLLLDLGGVGAGIWLLLAAVVVAATVARAVRGLAAWVRRRAGLGPRAAAAGVALVALAAVVLDLVPATLTVPGRWHRTGSGVAVEMRPTPPRPPEPGAGAQLRVDSWYGTAAQGTGRVSAAPGPGRAAVTLGSGADLGGTQEGRATIEDGPASLGGSLFWATVAPALGQVSGG